MDTPTKLLKTKKLEKKDMEAQIANIKSANCFSQTNSPNITLANKLSCTVLQKEQQESEEANTKVIHCTNLDVL